MGYVAAEDPESWSAPGWKSLKEWVQEYINYCKDWGETPRSRSAVTEMFKKMGVLSKRRTDGVWYYMEQRAVEVEKEDKDKSVVKTALEDLPPENDMENLPF